jgi:LPS sulfotransferase NodH
MSKHRVFIYGSCVSRDTFEHFDPEQFELVQYVARQSALSAYTRPVTLIEPPALESPFQQRMVSGDFASNVQSLIPEAAAQTDLVLVDLTDERLGAYVLPDGSVITRSIELIQSGAEQQLPAGTQHLAFGSDQHFQYWSQGIAAVGELIRAHMPRAAVVLLDIPWAERSETGRPTPDSFGLTAADANPVFAAYAKVAAEALHAELISLRADEVTSSPGHPWGDAPFHYAEDVYLHVVKELTGAPGRTLWGSPEAAESAQGGPSGNVRRRSVPGSTTTDTATPTSRRASGGTRPQKLEGGPNFLVLGTQRAGTAWLEHHLGTHPDVFMAPMSQGPILAARKRIENPKTRAAYLKTFTDAGQQRWRGQRSFLYFWTSEGDRFDPRREDSAAIVRDHLPDDAPLLVSLRDPVSRAISAYWHAVVLGKVAAGTSIFEAGTTRGILGIGTYARHYRHWANVVGADRLRVLLYDDLVSNPRGFLTQALDAIGAPEPQQSASDKVFGAPVNRNTTAAAMRAASPLSAAEIRVLVELYRADVDFVQELTGRDLSHWTDVDRIAQAAADPRR